MSRRSLTRPDVRVGDAWLSSIVPTYWRDLVTSTRQNGDFEASWSIGFERNWRHPALVGGAPVQVTLGPIVEFNGTLVEPDWDSGRFVAAGVAREPEGAIALDASGALTTVPNAAIDYARVRGVTTFDRLSDFGGSPIGDDGGGLVSLQSILDGNAKLAGDQWRITRDKVIVRYTPSEDTPKWFVMPGSGVFGTASDERADRVFVRYVADSLGNLATASYPAMTPPGGIERAISVVDRGQISGAEALAIAESTWRELQGRPGWTNGLTVIGGQVTTPGGATADLADIQAGETIRLLDVPDPRGLEAHVDVVIAETSYNWTEDQLQINPVGRTPRDIESLLEQVGTLAVDAMNKASGAFLG